MGKLTYDSSTTIDFDDRLLAHLQIVIGAKLRRHESFHLTWHDDSRIGDGRSAVWITPTVSLVFKYNGGRPPAINPVWIDRLMASANSSGGLRLIPEPPPGSARDADEG